MKPQVPQQVPPPPGPSPQGPSQPAAQPPPSLRLQYATPSPTSRWGAGPDAPILRAVRQVVFAVGLGLLAFGLVSAWAGVSLRDAPFFAGWGALFIGLSTPLWRVRKDE